MHHLVPRSEGGTHDAWNLTLLCSAHHTARHEGRLIIRGRAPDQLEFTHADGTRYGGLVTVHELFGKVEVALGRLRLNPEEARAAVEKARSHVGPGTPLDGVIDAVLHECQSAREEARPRDGC
jgi:hypothetical protein